MRQDSALRIKCEINDCLIIVRTKTVTGHRKGLHIERHLWLGDDHFIVISCPPNTEAAAIQALIDRFATKLKYLPSRRKKTYGLQKVPQRA